MGSFVSRALLLIVKPFDHRHRHSSSAPQRPAPDEDAHAVAGPLMSMAPKPAANQ